MFIWITNDRNFDFSRHEFFTIFNRINFNRSLNMVLTLCSKLLIKFIWDSKQHYVLPNIDHAKFAIQNEINKMVSCSNLFGMDVHKSGLLFHFDVDHL
jgi:hypothetical protein